MMIRQENCLTQLNKSYLLFIISSFAASMKHINSKNPQNCEIVILNYLCLDCSPLYHLLSSICKDMITATAAAAKSLQSCSTLCDPIDGSPPGSPTPGILQARTLEWVAISFSNAWKGKVKVKWLSRVQLFATPWSAAYQAPPSMGFSRQEYWSRVPLPSPKDMIISYNFLM